MPNFAELCISSYISAFGVLEMIKSILIVQRIFLVANMDLSNLKGNSRKYQNKENQFFGLSLSLDSGPFQFGDFRIDAVLRETANKK